MLFSISNIYKSYVFSVSDGDVEQIRQNCEQIRKKKWRIMATFEKSNLWNGNDDSRFTIARRIGKYAGSEFR